MSQQLQAQQSAGKLGGEERASGNEPRVRRLEACPGCGVAILVRKDGRLALHSVGRSNVAPGSTHAGRYCEGSERVPL